LRGTYFGIYNIYIYIYTYIYTYLNGGGAPVACGGAARGVPAPPPGKPRPVATREPRTSGWPAASPLPLWRARAPQRSALRARRRAKQTRQIGDPEAVGNRRLRRTGGAALRP